MDEMTRDLLIEIKYHREMREILAAQRDAKELARRHREASMAAKELGRNIERAADRVLSLAKAGVLIGGAAAGGLAWSFLQAARGAQETRLALTTLVQSADSMVNGPFQGVNDAFRYSSELMAKMRQEAISTPATFEDIKNSFRDVAVSARNAGAQYDDIIKLSGNMSTLGKVLGFEGGVVSRDVQQLLRGDIGEISTPQLRAIRMQAQELYKAGKSAEQLKLIMDAIKLPEPLRKMFEESFEGRLATLQDEWALFKQEAGKPILDYLNQELKEALDWINKNREQAKRWARDIGEGVVDAIKWVKDALKWIIDHREDIISWAKWLVGAAGLVKAVSLVGDIVNGFKGLKAVFAVLASHPFILALGSLAYLLGLLNTTPASQAKKDKELLEAYRTGGTGGAVGAAIGGAMEGRGILGMTDAIFGAADTYLNTKGVVDAAKERDAALKRLESDTFNQTQNIIAELQKNMGFRQDMLGWRMPGGTDVAKADVAVTPNTNIDARGAKITIHQVVKATNPAALARASLIDGFTSVAKHVIQPRQRPGSVGLGNGG